MEDLFYDSFFQLSKAIFSNKEQVLSLHQWWSRRGVNGTEMSRTLSQVSTDAAWEGKGIQATTAQSSLDPLLQQACITIQILFWPWDQCKSQGIDRESKPTHPILVYHSVYCPGKGKGWKRRRSYEQTKKLQVQEMSLGMPWSWEPGLTDGENRNWG